MSEKMPRVRSPNFPSLDIANAIACADELYRREGKSTMSRVLMAKHLGYAGLSGTSLGALGSLRAYGLTEGMSDNTKLTDEAIALLQSPEGSVERAEMLVRHAFEPKLFQVLRARFPSLPTDDVLLPALLQMGFTSEAAQKAARAYGANFAIVSSLPASVAPTATTALEIIQLQEGQVTITFPPNLSTEGLVEIQEHLRQLIRRLKRRALVG